MASCQTTRWVSTSPYVKLTVTQSSSDGDSAVLSWTLQYIADYAASTSVAKPYTVTIGGETVKDSTFAIGGKTGTHTVASGTKTITKGTSAKSVSFGVTFHFGLTWSGVYKGALSASSSISVAAKTSYTIQYNANGGSGAPSSQTKWYGTALTLSSTKPARTGYKFSKWNTAAGGGGTSYNSGASYTANAAATLYAQWTANTYTVSYNANGGSGAPANQTKTHGVTLKLQTATPTKTNYRFVGWSTSASATTATYAAGANFTANANTTLYAVWELDYIKPRITDFTVTRGHLTTTPQGGVFNMADDGTYALVSFSWECDKAVSGIEVEWVSALDEASSCTVNASGTSGTVTNFVATAALNPEATYTFTVTVTDESGYSVAFASVGGQRYTIDFLAGGNGAAFGKPAELDGVLDIAFVTKMNGGILPPLLPAETDLNEIRTPNTYTGENVAHYNYVNCPVANGTFILTVESCGDAGQVKQTFTTCSKYKPEVYSRFYYQNGWGDWCFASTDEIVLYENSGGTNGAITFQLGSNTADNPSATNYRYIEIYYTDNNGKSGGYAKVWSPNGKTVCLSIVEASSTIYSRQTMYTISGSTMTPDVTNASYFRINSAGTVSTSIGTNYIKIVRVIGRA